MTLFEAQQMPANFTMHRNTTLGAIAEKDPTYLRFLAGQPWLDFQMREAVAMLCQHHGIDAAALHRRDPNQGELFG